jgi:hypothetical protein
LLPAISIQARIWFSFFRFLNKRPINMFWTMHKRLSNAHQEQSKLNSRLIRRSACQDWRQWLYRWLTFTLFYMKRP